MAKGKRRLVWAGVMLAGMVATGGAVLAQTSEMHTPVSYTHLTLPTILRV